MTKYHIKIIRLFLLITTIAAESSTSKNQDKLAESLALAKRSLLERERSYFRAQPMSEDLRSFIERYKRKNQVKNKNTEDEGKISADKRRKRSGLDENVLYIVQNGQLVPLNPLKGIKRSEENKIEQPEGFTVVPLIIPINSQNAKLVKTRTLDEELQTSQKEDKASVPNASSAANSTSSVEASAGGENKTNAEGGVSVEDDGESANTTQEETKVLHKILEDVEGLMQYRHEGSKKEGVICNLNGSWISDAAGMRFDICYKNSTRKKFRIHVADRIPPNEDGFLCDGNWTVFGELPFIHSGMVIALAVHQKDKHIATFIGECRICEGSETVTGTWLIGRSSRDCKDQKAAHKILSDVWRREQGHILRKKHLQMIGYDVNDDDQD